MSNKEKVTAVIDSNEASMNPDLVSVIAMHEDTEDYKIKPLSEGDLKIDNCLFERKTPSDFASSLQEGRLRDQVERMGGTDKHSFILIEGDMEDYKNLEHSDIPPKSLRGMDASIEMRNNISVKYCSTIENLADMAIRLARKAKEETTVVQAQQTEAIKDPRFIEQVFLAIEGVGIMTAEALAVEFPTLKQALNATHEELKDVDGVGDTTANEIQSALHNKDMSDNSEDTTEKQVRSFTV